MHGPFFGPCIIGKGRAVNDDDFRNAMHPAPRLFVARHDKFSGRGIVGKGHAVPVEGKPCVAFSDVRL